jgi:hypothetical protein
MTKPREDLPIQIKTNVFIYECVNGSREYKQIHRRHIERLQEIIGEYGENIVYLTFLERDSSPAAAKGEWGTICDEILVVDHRRGGNTRIAKIPMADINARIKMHTNSSACYANVNALVHSKIIIISVMHHTKCPRNGEPSSNFKMTLKSIQSHYIMYEMQENLWSFRMAYGRWLYTENESNIHGSFTNIVLWKPCWVWDSNGNFIFVSSLNKNRNQIRHFRFLKEQNFKEYIVSLLQIAAPFGTRGLYPISAHLVIVPRSIGVNGLYSINQVYCRGSTNNQSMYSVAPDRRQRFLLDMDAKYMLFLDKHNRLIAWPKTTSSSLAMILLSSF